MAITPGATISAYDVLNITHGNTDGNVPQMGQQRIPIIINNATGVRNVYLYLRGLKANVADILHSHSHNHGGTTGTTAPASANGANASHNHTIAADATASGNLVNGTTVPKYVQIWIDGTQYTATIGDPNSKGGTMYSAGNGWGVDGTTEWNTGALNLSSLISWTAGEHYIEFRETGNFGGRIVGYVAVNTGY